MQEVGYCACVERAASLAMAGGSFVSGKVWEWQRDDGRYSPFPPEDSAKIEADFSARLATSILGSGDKLDFKKSVMVPARSRECTYSILYNVFTYSYQAVNVESDKQQ